MIVELESTTISQGVPKKKLFLNTIRLHMLTIYIAKADIVNLTGPMQAESWRQAMTSLRIY